MTATTTNFNPGVSSFMGNGGSGAFTPLRKEREKNAVEVAFNSKEKYDRTGFKVSRDPVYVAFDHLNKQPLSKLTADFVKETFTTPFKRMWDSLAA